MGGSQLTQLKTALNSAGLNRKQSSKKDKKAFKKGGAREVDRVKTLAKLEDIRKNLNKFDERETKVKHDVGGRNLKGVVGRPSASKQAGLEQRRKTLLPEHQLRGHTGTFRDRRFGETDPSMSLEDRMLERYTRERQRGQGRKGMFNLEDEDTGLDGFDESGLLGGLTHGGRSVSDLPGDDFERQGLGADEEGDEDDEGGRIQKRQVSRGHFGGFEEEADEDEPAKKKSKAEVMSEIIAKSKEHKYERQQQKELDADLRDELDENLDDLRALLQGGNGEPSGSRQRNQPRTVDGKTDNFDSEYDQFVRTLAFEARAKPKDRTKTEEEVAIEEAAQLQKAEARRLRRMRGEDVTDDEDDEERSNKRKRSSQRRGDADDLDDDFVDDEDQLLGPGLTREGIENMGKGKLSGSKVDSGDEESGSGDEDDDEDEDEGDEDEDEDDDEDDEDDEPVSDMEDLDDDVGEASDGSAEVDQLPTSRKAKGTSVKKEIPYTFTCPSSIEDFEDIMEDLEQSALPIVVQRIRALHHPSLAQGNKEKLQEFLAVLLDYVLILASQEQPAFESIQQLVPHIIALVKLNPIAAAHNFIAKLALMQKNLLRGLSRGASRPEAKTLPACPELSILRLVGLIWSSSDFSNPVVAPAVLLMCQYLSQSRIRSLSDISSGLFLCSLLASYETESKRLVPEAINFIAASLHALLPQRRSSLPIPDLMAPEVRDSLVVSTSPAEIKDALSLSWLMDPEEQSDTRANLVLGGLRLLQTFSVMYSGSDAFIELFSPILSILENSRVPKAAASLKKPVQDAKDSLARLVKFARDARQPLTMQHHKPIPIASYAPKFEDDFAPGKHYDPDVERNSAAKVKALYKKERKGAIRELRKDNRFLAEERAKEQAQKDAAYNAKMRRVEGDINMERAEEKEMQREKQREKRRAGRG